MGEDSSQWLEPDSDSPPAVVRDDRGRVVGGVLNPKGNNQLTYRDMSEREFERALIRRIGNRTRARQIVEKLVEDAEKGEPLARKLVVERILPLVQKHEITAGLPARSPEFIPTDSDHAALLGSGQDAGELH